MRDEETVNENTPLKYPSSFFYRPYNLFNRVGSQLGQSAIKAFVTLEDFLHKEIFLTPNEKLLHKRSLLRKQEDNEETREMNRLNKLVARSHETLASATAVFPFDLFPDTIAVDRTKITITKRIFFWSAEVISIRIEDILNVATSVGPFFGSVTISSRVMSTEDHFRTNYFWRKDAIHLKHIIQGYVIAQHNNIDVAHLSKADMIKTLSELGHDTNS